MTTTLAAGDPALHPGVELAQLLEAKGILDSSMSDSSGLSRPLISQITNGNRRITALSAIKICKIIGGDPMYWVKRQQEHDIWLKSRGIYTLTELALDGR